MPSFVKENDLLDIYKFLDIERDQQGILNTYPIWNLEIFFLAAYLIVGKYIIRKEEQGFEELDRVSVDEMVDDGFLPGEIEVD